MVEREEDVEGLDADRLAAGPFALGREDVEGLEVLGNRADAQKAVVVAEDEKVLEILDPKSYKTAVASRPRGMAVEEGDEVVVVRTGEGFIVLG